MEKENIGGVYKGSSTETRTLGEVTMGKFWAGINDAINELKGTLCC